MIKCRIDGRLIAIVLAAKKGTPRFARQLRDRFSGAGKNSAGTRGARCANEKSKPQKNNYANYDFYRGTAVH